MKQLNEQQLQTHVPLAGWLLIAYSLLQMVGGLIAFGVFMLGSMFWTQAGQYGITAGEFEATRALAFFNTATVLIGLVVGVLVIGLAIPGLVAGIGLLAHKSWARILAVIVSAFMVLHIPMGTLVGVYVIFVLMQDAATRYFTTPPAHLQTSLQPA